MTICIGNDAINLTAVIIGVGIGFMLAFVVMVVVTLIVQRGRKE